MGVCLELNGPFLTFLHGRESSKSNRATQPLDLVTKTIFFMPFLLVAVIWIQKISIQELPSEICFILI